MRATPVCRCEQGGPARSALLALLCALLPMSGLGAAPRGLAHPQLWPRAHSVGLIDAPKMGKRLAKRDVQPDLILSSPAMRALTTAEIIAKKLDYKLEDIVIDDRLYAGEADDLLNVIHKLGDKLERVMLFGHNPELTELTHRLSSKITHMPTCAVAEFTFVAKSWSNIGKAKPAKVALDYPKKS
jgi:phosphohistidine phosphatase